MKTRLNTADDESMGLEWIISQCRNWMSGRSLFQSVIQCETWETLVCLHDNSRFPAAKCHATCKLPLCMHGIMPVRGLKLFQQWSREVYAYDFSLISRHLRTQCDWLFSILLTDGVSLWQKKNASHLSKHSLMHILVDAKANERGKYGFSVLQTSRDNNLCQRDNLKAFVTSAFFVLLASQCQSNASCRKNCSAHKR